MSTVQTLRHYGENAASREEWARVIREERADFNAASMTGRRVVNVASTEITFGDLPEPYATQLRNGRPDYVVYSYETPIAWHDADTGKWHVPDVNYSLTTTGHQHTARMAVDTWDPEDDKYPHGGRWLRDYVSGPHVNLRKGKGKSPYSARKGW